MSDKTSKNIMRGILICLVIIALKPTPSFQSNFPSSLDIDNNGETIIPLAENRIAIVDNDIRSHMHGEVLILEFDETDKTFNVIGRYNYLNELFQ